MASCTANKMAAPTTVAMGQAVLASGTDQLTTILGSCIALTLYSPQLRLGMLSHVVLPRSGGPTSYPARFVDTAVPHMLSTLRDHGARLGDLVARMTGGACMFGSGPSMQIGEANVQAATEALAAAGVRIVGQDVGGTVGRRVCFDLATGSITVERMGQAAHTI